MNALSLVLVPLQRAYATVAASAVMIPGVAAAFLSFMFQALKDGRFTTDEEAAGRERWTGIYDAAVRTLRKLPFLKS